MDGDVQRTEMLLGYALPVLLCPVGESDEVAMKEGVTIIVVFDVQRGAHPRRRLINKAEGATVITTAQAIEDVVRELEAELLAVSPLQAIAELQAISLYL